MATKLDDTPKASGLDNFIKVLTILKLLIQLAFYGILLGSLLYFLLNNPIPGFIETMQKGVLDSFMAS